MGVSSEDVTVFEGDSSRGGFTPGAAGSRQGVIAGGAAIRAGKLLNEKIRRVAAHLMNANPDDVEIEGGVVRVAGASEMTRSLKEIAEIAYGEPARLPPGVETGLEAQYRYDPPPMTFTSAAHACVVEVDVETGFVKIKRWVSSEDCGAMINPAVVEGQIAGGLAQAIGTVLLEEAGYDERGNPIAATFKDYLLPTIFDVPDFEYVHANTPSKSEGGFRGVGEGGAIIGPPVLVNAIADALAPFGDVPVDLPLTPSKLLNVIDGKPQAKHHVSKFRRAAEAAAASPPAVAGPAAPALTPMAAAPAGVDGLWKITLAPPMGPAQQMTGRFTTEGAVLKGVFDSDQGSQDFEGTVEGNKLKFDLHVTQPMKITLKYDIDVDGDAMTGKVKMGMFGTGKLTGERLEPAPGAALGPVEAAVEQVPPAAGLLPGGESAALAEAVKAEPAPAAGVDGNWKITLAPPMGPPQQMTGRFTTDGAVLKGVFDSDQGSQDFEGKVDGSRLKFDLHVTQPMKITLKYDLEVVGDVMTGKVKMGMFGTGKLTGERIP